MEPTEEMLQNYDKANRLREWAELFDFDIQMGREDGIPYVMVDNVTIASEEVESALVAAALAMGWSEEGLNGDKPLPSDWFLRLR